MGEQQEPCVFHILPAGRPDPVVNCTVIQVSSDWAVVQCRPGYDGGLPQHFQMEVVDLKNSRRIYNRTEKSLSSPSGNGLAVRNLQPETTYELTFWAINMKGRSDPAVVYVETLPDLHPPSSTEKDRGTEPIGNEFSSISL